jgi:uncharacterized protein (TIGR03086 family)
METYDFGPATATMSRLVRGVTDEQLTAPTPCPKYTVADLVDHIGGLTIAFTGAATKTPVPGAGGGGQGDGSRLEEGWRDRIAGDLERLAAAWAEPAAYDGTTMAGPIEMPGPEAAAVALNEVVVHGWDLAQGTGQPFAADEATIRICTGFAEAFSTPETEALRRDAFGPVLAVPDDAPALDRLLGLMGRSPRPLTRQKSF